MVYVVICKVIKQFLLLFIMINLVKLDKKLGVPKLLFIMVKLVNLDVNLESNFLPVV
jgi:hypothetical protein